MKRFVVGLVSSLILLWCCSCDDHEKADLVLRGGKIATVDQSFSIAEAVAVSHGKILYVGTDADVEPFVGDQTKVINLAGNLVIPGFVEGHGHFVSLGAALMNLDLTKARSWDEIVQLVATATENAEADQWIIGRGWHQEKWDSVPEPAVEGLPLHHALSDISPNHPVYLTHASGHAAFVNAKAMEMAGISKDSTNPAGGEIVRGIDGEPTGMLRETAQRLVSSALANHENALSEDQKQAKFARQVQLAGDDSLSKGVTSFHDAGSSFATIDKFKQLADKGQLPLRLYVMVRGQNNTQMDELLPSYRMIGYGNQFLTVRSIKRQVDGALGSHGAWLLEPYIDLTTSTGLVLEPVDDIQGTADIAIKHGFQVNTHAIGDRANREMLDVYEKTFKAHPDQQDLRWRIEHAQHVNPIDVPRFKELGVIASMQGVHCTSDGPWVPKRLGEPRTKETSYLWRSFWDSGAVVTNGTDVPVEDVNPIASYYASVSRKMSNGEVFHGEQRLTREEALMTYTINGAFSAFEEQSKGSIEVGKLADMVILSQDILTVEEYKLPETIVLQTILAGKVVYTYGAED